MIISIFISVSIEVHQGEESTIRKELRLRHLALETERSYIGWIVRFIRHCGSAHLLEGGSDIRTVQDLLGHKDVQTTMIYTHVMNKPGLAVRSPADVM